ncbi:hypothetical protein F5B20DRAFT_579452 [Whalleya microplaca]|nr:hypothetical protein F5B20DRAFT_579452 [Whalleya microplaca]
MSIYWHTRNLFLNEEYSDLTITCGGREFKVHQAIESQSGIVDLPEDEPAIVEKFLSFLYKGNYEDGVYPTSDEPSAAALLSTEEIERRLEEPPPVLFGEEAPDDDDCSYAPSSGSDDYSDVASNFGPSFVPSICGYGPESGDQEAHPASNSEPTAEANAVTSTTARVSLPPEDRYEGLRKWNERAALSLFNSLRVYAMADKFDVSAARLLARERFYRAAQDMLSQATYYDPTLQADVYSTFADALNELYSTTAPDDLCMRQFPCRLIADRYHETGLQDKIVPVMRKHGDLAVGVLQVIVGDR